MSTLAWIVGSGLLMSAIAGTFLVDTRLGIMAWLAAAFRYRRFAAG